MLETVTHPKIRTVLQEVSHIDTTTEGEILFVQVCDAVSAHVLKM